MTDDWRAWDGWAIRGREGCQACDYGHPARKGVFCYGHAGCHASGGLEQKPSDLAEGCTCKKCLAEAAAHLAEYLKWADRIR